MIEAAVGSGDLVVQVYHGTQYMAEVDESDDMQRRYVHGTTYIDERAIMIAGDPDVETPQIDTYYYLLQELYTAVGLIKRNDGWPTSFGVCRFSAFARLRNVCQE